MWLRDILEAINQHPICFILAVTGLCTILAFLVDVVGSIRIKIDRGD